jgi:SNF2 family DNA or RNA helicase
MQESYAFFMDMGTGKSKTFIDNAGILFCQQKIDGVLVIAPKGVYRNWSDIEIPKHFPDHLHRRVTYWRGSGATKAEKKAIKEITTTCPEDTLDFFIVNVEALGSDACWNACVDFISKHAVLMGIDESTIIKNYRAKRTKHCMDLGKKVKYRRIMSGFPITRNPLDLYSQCAFLDQRHLQPHLNGRRSVSDFKAQYAIEIANPSAPEGVTQIVGWKNLEHLTGLVDKFSSRVLKSECLDLPPKTYQYWDVELSAEQKKVYKELSQSALAQLDDKIVSTEHMLPLITKLHQAICGHVKWDDGQVERIPNNRIKDLLQIAEGITTKFIVWSGYEETITEIEEKFVERYGREAVASYWGKTKDSDRVDINKNFEDPDHPLRIFIGNPAAAGWGLTLVQAKTMIYYSNTYNLEHRMQSEDRFHRAGQTDNVTIIDMRAPKTIDEKIIEKLRSKIDIAEQSLGDTPRDWLT